MSDLTVEIKEDVPPWCVSNFEFDDQSASFLQSNVRANFSSLTFRRKTREIGWENKSPYNYSGSIHCVSYRREKAERRTGERSQPSWERSIAMPRLEPVLYSLMLSY